MKCNSLSFFKWQPFAILNSWGTFWDDPQRVLGGLYCCAKFGWNRCSSFDNMKVWLISAFLGRLGVKMGDNGHFFVFIPLGIQQPRIDIVWNKPRKNWFCGLVSACEQIFRSQKGKGKLKPHDSDISHICQDASTWVIVMNFGMLADIADYHPCQILC